jgi:two-component system, sensor histidine kinase YesM
LFEISDDGIGMAEEESAEISRRLAGNEELPAQAPGGKSIGLYNIHNRIQLYYGKQYGVRVSSVRDAGTTVSILLPILRE